MSEPTPKTLRFGVFEVDLAAGELRKHGTRIHLQEQPFQVLTALLECPGAVVSREELIRRLWPDGTVVEFDRGLNAAVTRLRQALADSAESPRYVETAARRGYRFIAEVQTLSDSIAAPLSVPGSLPPRSSRGLLWVGISVVPVALLAIAIGWWVNHRQSATDETAWNIVPLTTEPGFESIPSFSPDGNQVVFEWDKGDGVPHIYLKLVGPGDPIPLTSGTAGEFGPAWSPDGRQVAFLRKLDESTVGVFVIPALGGVERQVGQMARSNYVFVNNRIRRLDWTRDSSHLIVGGPEQVEGSEGLFVLSVVTGEQRWLTKPSNDPYSVDHEPAVSPDGRTVAFVRGVFTASESIYLLRLTTDLRVEGEPQPVPSAALARSPVWTPDGLEIVFTRLNAGRAWILGLCRTALKPGATARELTATRSAVSVPAISRTGRLVYSRITTDMNVWRQEIPVAGARTSPPVSLIASTALDFNPQYSPDGTKIAFASSRSGNLEIWVCNAGGAHCVQLTNFNGPYITGTPRWSPDGKSIAFDSTVSGKYDVYVVDVNGGASRRLTNDSSNNAIPSWSRDGSRIYFQSQRSGRGEVWEMPSGGGTARQVTSNGGMVAFEAPDGAALYYTKTERDATLWKSALDGSGEVAVLEHVAVRAFALAADRIYYLREEPGRKTTIRRFLLATHQDSEIASISKPTRLGLSLSPDGRSLIYTQMDTDGSDLMLMENFR